MKKVYLVNLPFEGQDERQIQSMGMAYIASELIHNGIQVNIFDGCGVDRNRSCEELYTEILYKQPDYIGFYVIEHNYKDTINFINRIAEKVNSVFFLGGPQTNFLADSMLESEGNLDFILVGESEGKLDKIINGNYKVNGLLYRQGNHIIKNNIACDNRVLDELFFPVREISNKCLLTQEMYKGKMYYMVPISTSRGCPFSCSFCSVPALVKEQKIQWRFRSPENIIKEVQEIYTRYKEIYIRVIDDNFFVDIKRGISICKGIHEIGEIPISFAARANSILDLQEEEVQFLKKCGVTSIEIGVENFNNHVLERYRKNTSSHQMKAALKKLIKNGIYPGIDFIMFDPWTTIQDLKNNYATIVELGLDNYYPPFLTNRLYPFPGSEYYLNETIDMNHYFNNEDVGKVYFSMQLFMNKYKQYKRIIEETNARTYIKQLFYRMPYKVFGFCIHYPDVPIEKVEIINRFEEILFKETS